jgi:hypothetical protein
MATVHRKKGFRDDLTVDMFEIPQADVAIPGQSNYAGEVSELVSLLICESLAKDRWEISANMSRLSGRDVSKNMVDAYCSPARTDHALPFWLAPILEQVCGGHCLTNWLVAKRGGRVAYGADALDAEIGKLELLKCHMNKEISGKIKRLKQIKEVGANG